MFHKPKLDYQLIQGESARLKTGITERKMSKNWITKWNHLEDLKGKVPNHAISDRIIEEVNEA